LRLSERARFEARWPVFSWGRTDPCPYPLVNSHITMENHHLQWNFQW
jgi:hypothetical protein